VAGDKRRRKERAPRKIIKRTSFPSFTSVTIQQQIMSAATAAEIASVSSEFNIFASGKDVDYSDHTGVTNNFSTPYSVNVTSLSMAST